MQLMTFNSLLMFDIVFIFFLFLVGVTCLVYYLPPRELAHDPQPPPSATPCSAFPSPASGGPLVRGCASAARRISGEGGTPIILVQHHHQQQQQQSHEQQQQQQQRVVLADAVDPAEPTRNRPPPAAQYPYPTLRIVDGGAAHEAQQQQQQQEVLLLDCSLEDIIALRRMATVLGSAEPCRSCCCQYQPPQQIGVDRWTSGAAPHAPSPTPLENQLQEYETDEQDEERVEYVRIEIERSSSAGAGGKCPVAVLTAAAPPPPCAGEPASMPACCYVRAKETDIRACRGPIHDV
uniref:Uncharacterized protein n=1 Tax=Anopheles dirus TaxID=7168 RepID=A0A182NAE7_9DIPT